ncbi:MAG: ATP-binding protein [Holophagaceae bacterium]|nr:ATP-binding protein [Holophagaceae bacterium]
MSMRVKATLIIILVIVAIRVGGSLSDLSFTTKSLIETIKNEQILEQSLANELASTKIELLNSNAVAAASHLSRVMLTRDVSREMQGLLERYPEFVALTIFNRDGVEASFGIEPATENMLYEGHNLAAAFEGKSIVTTTQLSASKDMLVIYFCVPMEGGRALAATMPARIFSDYFSGHKIWKTGSIYIIDGQGTLIVHNEQERVYNRHNPIELGKTDPSMKSTGDFFQKMILTKEGSGTYILEGTEKLCSYKYIVSEHVDWILGIVAPFNESPIAKLRWGLVISSLVIFALGSLAAYIISGYAVRPYYRLEELNKTVLSQAALIHDEHKRTKLMLDSTPLCCYIFDENHNVIECNESALRLFNIEDKQEFFDRFPELSPEFQPDGQISREAVDPNIQKAFNEGRHHFSWIHSLLDGSLIPAEVTLVRVPYGDRHAVVGYTRDMREHEQMMSEIKQRDKMLRAGQGAAALLLTTVASSYESFEGTLRESMKLIGIAVDADRVQIWQNEVIDCDLYSQLKYEWLSETGRQMAPIPKGFKFAYKDKPQWEARFVRGGHINSAMSDLPPDDQEFLCAYDIKSIIIIPLFLQSKFWGFLSLDDCRRERAFSDDEISILRSVGLMFTSAVNRDAQSAQINEALNRTKQLMDMMPLGCDLWDENFKLYDSNEAAAKLFGIEDKHDYLNRFYYLSPKFQPDGQPSLELSRAYLKKAFEGERCVFEWMHCNPGGDLLPMEITLIRHRFGDEYIVAAYKRDMTKYKQMTAELEKAMMDAKDANDAKSNFLASMSHEMRTPLNAVLGLSELALETPGMDEEVYTNLEKIYAAGSTLLNTVNDILDISKIEAGKFEIIAQDYDLPSLINDTVTQNILRIGEKAIQFELDINSGLPARLKGDELRIKQVLNNLLSNALKYTKEGTVQLSIASEREGDSVWVTARVKDTGIGIKAEELDKLFRDYTQLDLKSNYRVEGTGLGLSITKKILEMMDGTISVESDYEVGSTFTARFRQKFVSDDVIGNETVENLKSFHYSINKRGQHLRYVRASLPYARVLVVDDIATNLDVAKGLMKPYQMQIDCVTSGQQAIDAIRDEKVIYNAVFMDHMMPGMDGVEAARIIREEIGTDYARTVPIIAFTANAILGNEKMFLENGFQAFLPKPIDITRLDEVINRWVRNKDYDAAVPGPPEGLKGSGPTDDDHLHSERRSGIDRRIFGQLVPELDAHNGIDRFGGILPYMEILQSYVTNTRPMLETINEVGQVDLRQYTARVHGIKGASQGIGAFEVGGLAAALEKAAKDEDFDFLNRNNQAFIEAAHKLLDDLEKLLNVLQSHGHKPKKDKPDKELLAELLVACNEYNMDRADDAMAKISACDYESDNDLVVWLRENVSLANFSQIAKRLSTLLN